jgi:cytochrome c oxidase subunit 6b
MSVLTWVCLLSQFYLAYRSLCPNAWVMRWNDQREAGNFPVDLEH